MKPAVAELTSGPPALLHHHLLLDPCVPRLSSAVSLAVQLDPAALVGAGGVMAVVDDQAAGVGIEVAVGRSR